MSSPLAAFYSIVTCCALFVGAQQPSALEPGDEAGPMLLETEASVSLLATARRDLHAYRMQEAERSLRRLQQRPDGSAAALYHLALAALHRGLMGDDEAHLDVFQQRSDSLAAVLGDADPSAWRDVMAADRQLWEAIAHLKQARYVRGAWAGRSAYRGYQRVLGAFPDFYHAYRGLGILHLSIGSMPRSYRFVLDILGYDGGIALGIGEIETAYRESEFARLDAGLFLAVTHVMLHLDERQGLRITTELLGAHPQSILLAHIHGFVLIANRRVDEAAALLRDAIRRAETTEYFYDHYLDFYLAQALFRSGDYAGAERYFRRYLQRHEGPELKATTYLGLGAALELQGRRSEAVEAFERVRAARTFDTEEAARREAERFLAGPLSPTDRELLQANNAFDSNRLEEASRLLVEIRNRGDLTIDQAAEVAYRLGRVHHVRGQFEAAVHEYERAVEVVGDPTRRWAPWSAFFIGKIRIEQGRREEALEAFDRALSFKGKYDFYQALEQGVRAAIELSR